MTTTHQGQQFTGNRQIPTDYWTGHPQIPKAITIRTLTRRAQQVYNTTDSLSDENKHLDRVISKNNYNEDFIQRSTHRPTTTKLNSYDHSNYTIHKGHKGSHKGAHPKTIQYPPRSQTYYHTTSVTG